MCYHKYHPGRYLCMLHTTELRNTRALKRRGTPQTLILENAWRVCSKPCRRGADLLSSHGAWYWKWVEYRPRVMPTGKLSIPPPFWSKGLCAGKWHIGCAKSLSHAWLVATPWTAICQAPLSLGFSRPAYWSGLLFPPPGDLLDAGIEPESLMSPELADGFLTTSATWEAGTQGSL